MEEKTFLSPIVKAILIFTVILLTGILLIAIGNPFKKFLVPVPSPVPQINVIEISSDAKSILNADTDTSADPLLNSLFRRNSLQVVIDKNKYLLYKPKNI